MDNFILLQAQGKGGGWELMVMMVLIFGVMYFFMIRPQQKKQKDELKWRDTLKVGDKVVTIGGLHGSVVAVDGEKVVLSVDNGVRLTFNRTAISQEATNKYYGESTKLEKK
ncbi:MAG TPA: preprotein translocase subunit YajC [Cytophagales bacterium]|nr:preprotein translocase subunit YajC [Cytophagales bacterium]